MRRLFFILPFLFVLFALSRCANRETQIRDLLPSFVKDSIYLNGDNPFTEDKAELGRYLFYDRRLSVNNTKACATCHSQEFSFTDSYNRSIGAMGDLHQRNSRPLINLVFQRYLTSSDSTLHFPEQQMNNPMFNEHPVEMGIKGNEQVILQRVQADKYYAKKFKQAFPGDQNPITISHIQFAISSFIKTIFSFDSPYDRYTSGKNKNAMTPDAIKGMQLFFSRQLHCSSCHGGINFNQPTIKDEKGGLLFYYNTGLYNVDGKGSYPPYDQGLIALTGSLADMGKYRVPTLRNLAFTAPYLHDGSGPTLEDVIKIYEKGGRQANNTSDIGNGVTNPYKHPMITGFKLNLQQRKELVSFLLSLSDSSITETPSYSNPFTSDETKKDRP